jgi:hypothetical protein
VVKTAVDLNRITKRFVTATKKKVPVERVLLAGDHARGNAYEHSDIRLIVISPAFEEMNLGTRSDLLALIGLSVDPHIQSWGYSPSEFQQPGLLPFLTMMLAESRQVYPDPADEDPGEAR